MARPALSDLVTFRRSHVTHSSRRPSWNGLIPPKSPCRLLHASIRCRAVPSFLFKTIISGPAERETTAILDWAVDNFRTDRQSGAVTRLGNRSAQIGGRRNFRVKRFRRCPNPISSHLTVPFRGGVKRNSTRPPFARTRHHRLIGRLLIRRFNLFSVCEGPSACGPFSKRQPAGRVPKLLCRNSLGDGEYIHCQLRYSPPRRGCRALGPSPFRAGRTTAGLAPVVHRSARLVRAVVECRLSHSRDVLSYRSPGLARFLLFVVAQCFAGALDT